MPTDAPPSADPQLWDTEKLRNPHAASDKARRVRDMFAAIAPSYDLNNRLFSLGIDQRWRKKAVKLSALKANDVVVDVACGTGDLTLAYASSIVEHEGKIADHQVLGVDFTYEMLPSAVRKSAGLPRLSPIPKRRGGGKHVDPERLNRAVDFLAGDALALPLPDGCCDVVSIAFGIRNVADPAAALAEFRRVLRPGGRVVVLEFSLPTNPVIRAGYNFYFNQVLTRAATLVSGDKTGAYHYLSASVNTFIGREQMADLMRAAGFGAVEQHPLTFGVAVCYVGLVAS